MAGALDIEEHLVFYRKYHFNHKNVLIHLCCIPIILLSCITFFTPILLLGPQHQYVNLGSLMAWGYGLYYVALDWKLGVPLATALVFFVRWIKAKYLTLSAEGQLQFIKYAIGVHVVCWLAQFYGHAVHEKRAPALLDNLLQAVVLAPFFVVYEVAFFLGFKLDVKKRMDNRAGLLVKKMNEARHK